MTDAVLRVKKRVSLAENIGTNRRKSDKEYKPTLGIWRSPKEDVGAALDQLR